MKKLLSTILLGFIGISLSSCTSYGIYDDADKYLVGNQTYNENITSLDIDWVSGTLTIVEDETITGVKIEEETNLTNEKELVHSYLDNGELKIKFFASGYSKFGFGSFKKNLILTYHPGFTDIEIDLTSGTFNANSLTADKVDVDLTSGSANIDTITANKVDVDFTSGRATINHINANEFDSDMTSGSMTVKVCAYARISNDKIVSRELFDKVQKIMDGNIQHFKIKPVNSKEFETDYTRFIYCPYCGSNYFAKKNRHPELLSPTIRRMFYCRSNQSRKLCPESESIYQVDLDQIIAKQIGILKSNTKEFRKAIIDAFSKDKKLELESEVNKLESEIAEYRKTLKGITDRTEISVQQLCEHYRWEIKKRSRKKLALENEMLTLVNPETKADSIMAILRDLPFADSADDVDFRKLFCRVIVYSRNKLLFIIGNDNMEKVPNNVQPLFKGTHSYKVRCSTFTTEFGVYINA